MGKILESIIISASTVPEAVAVFGIKPKVEVLALMPAIEQWECSAGRDRNTFAISNMPILCPVTIPELAHQAMADVRRWITDPRDLAPNLPICAVVPLMSKNDYLLYKKTLTVTLTADEWEEHLLGKDITSGIIKDKLGADANTITSHSILANQPVSLSDRRAGWNVDYSVETSQAAGRAKTIYRLKIDGVIDTGKEYPTIPSARSMGKRIMNSRPEVRTIEITAEIQKENNAALITLERKVNKATASFDVTYARVVSKNPTVTDYAVSFWCHTSKRKRRVATRP